MIFPKQQWVVTVIVALFANCNLKGTKDDQRRALLAKDLCHLCFKKFSLKNVKEKGQKFNEQRWVVTLLCSVLKRTLSCVGKRWVGKSNDQSLYLSPYLGIVSKFPPEILSPCYELSFSVVVHQESQLTINHLFHLKIKDFGWLLQKSHFCTKYIGSWFLQKKKKKKILKFSTNHFLFSFSPFFFFFLKNSCLLPKKSWL